MFVIADLSDDRALGIIGLRHLDPPMRPPRSATWLGRTSWGTGVNDEAKGLLLDFAFGPLGLHRVEARIALANVRSRKAFERLGGRREGVLKESFLKDGEYQDQDLYVVLEPDWRARRRGRRASKRPAAKDGDL